MRGEKIEKNKKRKEGSRKERSGENYLLIRATNLVAHLMELVHKSTNEMHCIVGITHAP